MHFDTFKYIMNLYESEYLNDKNPFFTKGKSICRKPRYLQ
ncbi:hypothetical protein ANACAC_02483 [Anaerostipes caccae L1-92]|uniref:Uncharacterized protein n=1 Tax=Anaerostipes caccae (strain DSM 14662 / CCUG 47493 / JCM 13470 / NCIMB 13811 / L1-92) TaxID=411490 RepID=B0MFE8_ANACD|nr:hypothetical protein ANACAC_02483 [Anaerostipes caccae L1-92]